MPANLILIAVGVLLIAAGLAKLRNNWRGGFNLRNFGITIGGTNTQTNTIGDAAPSGAKPDWIGLAIALIGLLTALVGLFKG